MRKAGRVITGIVKGLLVLVVGLLAFYNIYMLIARYALHDDSPTFFGIAFAVVASGSMEPTIAVGDVIVTKAQESYAEGDIVTYRDGSGGTITHRILSISDDAFIAKGDANTAQDGEASLDAIVGKVVAVWAGAGNVVTFFQSPLGLLAVLAAGVVIWLLTDILTGIGRNKKDEEQRDGQT